MAKTTSATSQKQKYNHSLPQQVNKTLEALVHPHVDSYDAFVENPNQALKYIQPYTFELLDRKIVLKWTEIEIKKPIRQEEDKVFPKYPREVRAVQCRKSVLCVALLWIFDEGAD